MVAWNFCVKEHSSELDWEKWITVPHFFFQGGSPILVNTNTFHKAYVDGEKLVEN